MGLGKDELTWVKIISAVLIFTGVYLVTKKSR
jgi:drug/metabolite transporter (DMT)-like permease